MLTRDIFTAEIKKYYKLMLMAEKEIDVYYYCFAASAIILFGYDLGILLYDESVKAVDIIYDKFYLKLEELKVNEQNEQ